MTVAPAGRLPGEFPFDPVLRDLAAHADRATARTTAKFTEYPDGRLHLSGAAWPWRPTLLCAATLAAAVALGLQATVLTRRRALSTAGMTSTGGRAGRRGG